MTLDSFFPPSPETCIEGSSTSVKCDCLFNAQIAPLFLALETQSQVEQDTVEETFVTAFHVMAISEPIPVSVNCFERMMMSHVVRQDDTAQACV